MSWRRSDETADVLQRIWETFIRQIWVVLATLIVLFPIYFMLVSSFKTQAEYVVNKWGLPRALLLDNFTTALAGTEFFRRFANSTILMVGAVVISSIIACLAAFAFARADWKKLGVYKRVRLEFLKLPGYWIRYGVNPF